MIDIVIGAIALTGFIAISLFGGRFVAAEDARARLRNDPDGSVGWLPSRRDVALLRQSARGHRPLLRQPS